MDFSFFLYRRLAPWITCQFSALGNVKLSLKNKYEVASFQDVFCHPFYWQTYNLFNSAPKLIVDCGAHCGHFTILTDVCLHSKFGSIDTHYILIEPNPKLLPLIEKNLKDANLKKRTQVVQGLLGAKTGQDKLWVNPKNFLDAGSIASRGARSYTIDYLDLENLIGEQDIDLIKIDIEGGEFDFIKYNLKLFHKIKFVVLELHQGFESRNEELFSYLKSIGLNIAEQTLEPTGHRLLIFRR